MLLAVLTACTPDSRTADQRRAEAARADSSAAGYDVGAGRTAASETTHVAPTDSTADSTAGGLAMSPQHVAVVPPPTHPVPTPVNQTPARPPVTPVDTHRASGGRGGSRPGDPDQAGLPPLDPATAATFLAFDSTKKIVTFQLAAGNELDTQVSFNGARRGGRILTVPVGWRINIEFTNRDPELPHSAAIIAGLEPVPEQLPSSAFPQAQTAKIEEGLLEGDSDQFTFVADRGGRYFIACAVLGHAQRGQWLVLDVSTTATIPAYR
jgi:hypothetical protein